MPRGSVPDLPRKVLFLMHEGVGTTIFQSQVAIHALEMVQHGYDVEIWTYDASSSALRRSRQNLERIHALGSVRVRLFRGIHVFLPLSVRLNALLLRYHLRRSAVQFDLVHARADYSAAVYAVAGNGFPMLWDCRGDAYPETEQALVRRGVPALVRRLVLRSVREQERRAGLACRAANFVSELLRERKGRSMIGKPAFVIPCAVSERYFHFSSDLRAAHRAALGLAEDDVVLVYSGAMTTYQAFGAYVDLVATVREASDLRIQLLVVTPDIDRARTHLRDRLPEHAYRLRTASYEHVNEYLNAADFGVLLREPNAINDVASPTKFGEYCLAGLPVILDGNVRQTIEVSRALGNYVSHEETLGGKRLEPLAATARERIAASARRVFSRAALNAEYARLYEVTIASAPAGDRL